MPIAVEPGSESIAEASASCVTCHLDWRLPGARSPIEPLVSTMNWMTEGDDSVRAVFVAQAPFRRSSRPPSASNPPSANGLDPEPPEEGLKMGPVLPPVPLLPPPPLSSSEDEQETMAHRVATTVTRRSKRIIKRLL